jgi:hypothetical protein
VLGMTMLEAALFAAILALPLYLLSQLERTRLHNPRYVRSMGAVVQRQQLKVEGTSEVLGYYDGGEIYATVDYMGMRYRFDRVVPPSYQYHVGPRELYVVPGLLYVTD